MNSRPIAVISDTQQTSLFERVLGRESNLVERNILIQNLANENPQLIIHLGDACFSPTQKYIKCFETALKPIQKLKVRKLMIPGNHDYKLFSRTSPKNKFPFLEVLDTWSHQKISSTALIFLNSNKLRLSKDAWREQIKWFENIIPELDHDSSIKHILVFAHHPPFTNSSVTKDETHVQKAFLQKFLNSQKTRAFISGHVHAYERFVKNGKTFIVAGGGGGPRVRLNSARHDDGFKGATPRPFHYLLICENQNSLEIEVKGFEKGERIAKSVEQLHWSP